ncbi:Mov34/MPN/PAD-1 family protein [Corallococcus sp. Z5C101001]|uniref:Mov34/MPN/PAD-1 family protein n=1 Tax=Corallococcus sp. Z5C101001 TaxID=2596829 RepID=UPI00117CC8B4|nr:Mov34/MPN/PAD-1 family protein [Corallococcus sp. Z5C101001]TSC33934.1 hypothetical protein FOF48_02485 [Corallococcus sp. Z5C101001]
MEGLVFRRANDTRVKVDTLALEQMIAFRQVTARHPEGGGVLLGRFLVDCDDVVVDEVTVPMPGDRQRRLAFYRSRMPHQRIIDIRWRESQGTCQYLGEWHTHPESRPTPSCVDLTDWRRRLREDHFASRSILFLIVGIHEVRGWEGFRHSLEIHSLRQG